MSLLLRSSTSTSASARCALHRIALTSTPASSSSAASSYLSSSSSALTSSVASSLLLRRHVGREVRMRVVLREDHPRLGLAHDVVTVKRGYGRNVLIRQGKAEYATEEQKYLSKVRQQKQTERKLAQLGTEGAAQAATTEANAKESATAAALSSSLLSPDATRLALDLSHRLNSSPPLLFYRSLQASSIASSSSSSSSSPSRSVSIRDIYVKLSRNFPGLMCSQISFSPTGGDSATAEVSAIGEHSCYVTIPGLAKPAQVKVVIKQLKARTGAAAGVAQQNATAAKKTTIPPPPTSGQKPATSASIKG